MKKKLLTSCLLMLSLATCSAEEIGGIWYTLSDDGTAAVSYNEYIEYVGDIVIPFSITNQYGNNYIVTSINSHAFLGRTGITSVTIPSSVTSIGYLSFAGCTGLTNITIPNSVMRIGEGAFEDCTGLMSVNIPSSVTSIGAGVLSGCTALKSITVDAANTFYNSDDNCNAIIESATNTLIVGCPTTIIPKGVTNIGEWAFSGFVGLKDLTIPNSVTSIGDHAFQGCTDLTIEIPGSVNSIGCKAFQGCHGQTNITLHDGVMSIGAQAFEECSELTTFSIPNSVTSMGESVFAFCTSLNSIVMPNGMTRIEAGTFYGCTSLTNVIIPNSVTYIDHRAFQGCTNMTSIEIPNSVIELATSIFEGCTSLKKIVLGNAVAKIGLEAFAECNLENITILRAQPPVQELRDGEFSNYGLPSIGIVYVPAESLSSYRADSFWGRYNVNAISAATVQTWEHMDINITTHGYKADVTWPVVDDATSYELTITSNGVVICTLTFDAQGQLTNIAFRAPAEESAQALGQGFQFTVTGLEDGSVYLLTLNAKDAAGNVLKTFSQDFSTGATAIDEVNADGVALKPRKVLEEGRVIILMPDGRKFDANGRQIK